MKSAIKIIKNAFKIGVMIKWKKGENAKWQVPNLYYKNVD